jgi:hypothetical protein
MNNPSGEIFVEGGIDCDSIVFVSLEFYDEIILVESVTQNDNGSGNGFIEPIIAGGSGEYNYLWSNGETTLNIDNLSTGMYTLFVEDSEGCTGEFMFEIELNTSVDEAALNSVLVYPNPFDEFIKLENLPPSVKTILIFNTIGQVVMTVTLDRQSELVINSHGLEKGVYFIQLMTDENKSVIIKSVKE